MEFQSLKPGLYLLKTTIVWWSITMTLGPRCRFQQSSAVGPNLKWKLSSVSRPCELLQVQQSRPVVSSAPSCASQHSVFCSVSSSNKRMDQPNRWGARNYKTACEIETMFFIVGEELFSIHTFSLFYTWPLTCVSSSAENIKPRFKLLLPTADKAILAHKWLFLWKAY